MLRARYRRPMPSESLEHEATLEAAVRRAVCQFQVEFMAGSFAERIRVFAVPDMIVVRSQGSLSTTEQHLIRTEEGRALAKQMYRMLFARHGCILANQVAALTGMAVTDVLTDFAVSAGEHVIIFLLAPRCEN